MYMSDTIRYIDLGVIISFLKQFCTSTMNALRLFCRNISTFGRGLLLPGIFSLGLIHDFLYVLVLVYIMDYLIQLIHDNRNNHV